MFGKFFVPWVGRHFCWGVHAIGFCYDNNDLIGFRTIELEDWEEQGEEEPHTEDQEVVPEPPRKRRAPLADPELGDDVELPAPSPMDHTGEEHMAETAEDEPKPAEAAAPQDVECEMEVGKDLDKSSSPPETMPGTLNAEPVPGDMSFPLQDSQGTLLYPACFVVLFCFCCWSRPSFVGYTQQS